MTRYPGPLCGPRGRFVRRYVTTRGVPGVVAGPLELPFADPARLSAELRQRLSEVSE